MTFTISAFWAQIIAGLLVSGVVGLFTLMLSIIAKLSNIEITIAKVNGRLDVSAQWQEMHEKQDQERHDEARRECISIWSAVDKIRVQ